ncbi:MAG: hypothetical protein IT170_10895 [Bryobacterales bacterium]|nr:hypothetical protein [Bryobacterales bacterium]
MRIPQFKASESAFEKAKQIREFATIHPQAATTGKKPHEVRTKHRSQNMHMVWRAGWSCGADGGWMANEIRA